MEVEHVTEEHYSVMMFDQHEDMVPPEPPAGMVKVTFQQATNSGEPIYTRALQPSGGERTAGDPQIFQNGADNPTVTAFISSIEQIRGALCEISFAIVDRLTCEEMIKHTLKT